MADALTTLYRPVGLKELQLIRASGFRSFPPRLPGQPFFYPVLTEEYAVQIARDWNTKDESSGYEGYVLKFEVRNEFLERYEIHVVGSSSHREYWIPAAELEEFNRNIVGAIQVIYEFRGSPKFTNHKGDEGTRRNLSGRFSLRGRDSPDQIFLLRLVFGADGEGIEHSQ